MPVSTVTSSVSSQVTYPVMVNGFLCYSAAEVQAVRRGQSPDSVKPGAAPSANGEAAAAQAQVQAQAQALTEAQNRIAQFAQAPQDVIRQAQQQGAPRGGIVDIYA
ncbi:hypothetical protein [Magnetospirillum sulfuroxidans]|uniref:Uncharacterized protein n=1 Tax=Magnetospirillum sulfuroxidans TaxID=611300 RepID=A0ABS5IAH9_9PROT|nr:hypothetical protein [Magnetospirillum sulfuroxidans]MBR9971420.1 hypothetical protein [Magnetospirillum sulfuroxidans]